MGTVKTGLSMSLDGFIGGLGDQAWPVHELLLGWKFDLASFRERIGLEGGQSTIDSEIESEEYLHNGAYVMGRRMFDSGEVPWGDNPPFHAPVFVLTHHARATVLREGGTSFIFVTDGIESAIRQAKAVAQDKDVFISGGASGVQQALKAGLLDELQLHVVPVLLGEGVRLFEHLGTKPIELERVSLVEGTGVTHLRFRIIK
ncbi:MAG: dihydrofolate reductase [Herpetosiphonaceae bacterium]|nr:dihydrofolate reductase [Herpetosiphonaceae bacterium]